MLRSRFALLVMLVAVSACGGGSQAGASDAARRAAMVQRIEQLAAAFALGGSGRIDPRVLEAMREVPRHRFVPDDLADVAYEDVALPIGYDSTISQPFMVATMTDLLQVRSGDKVLEVGTGSGYQAAILSKLGARVFTIEIVAPLAKAAEERLASLGYRGIEVRTGDGYKGWPQEAPFDRIMVTAGATHMPKPLTDQLKPGGRMVIPVGESRLNQELFLVSKAADGTLTTKRLGPVAFVPLDERARRN